MKNKEADRFVRNFRASIGHWKMPDDTVALYLEELSPWNLKEKEWRHALKMIIADNEKGELIPLAQIFGYLRRSQETQHVTGLGWMTFIKDCKPHAVRIVSRDNAWVFAACVTHDRNGKEEILQNHPGEPAVAPDGATDIHFVPDEPAREDYVTGIEAHHYFAQGYAESGGPPELLEKMFHILVTP